MARILITRPEHDPLTRHLSHWNIKVIESARSKGNDVIDLRRNKANKNEFNGRINKIDPALVLLNGHGDNDTVCGHDNEILVKTGENEALLKRRITYAVACSSARVLGAAVCIDAKSSFIGYDEYFILNLDRKFITNPLQDKRAEKFLDPSNRVGISLVKGHTCKEASENSKRAFRRNIALLLTNTNDPDALDDAKDLYWNMNHQVCLGDGNAKL